MPTPLLLSLIVLALSVLVEKAIYFIPPLWRKRKVLAPAVIFLSMAGSGMLVVSYVSPFSIIFALVSIYRVLNCLRLSEDRINEEYLKSAARRSFIVFVLIQLLTLVAWYGSKHLNIKLSQVLLVIGSGQLAAALTLLLSTIANLRRSQLPAQATAYDDKNLPTLSVAIPARNETTDLTECLEALLASDYPKLEILVLDDCSQVATSNVIKDFAHRGVRFIQGQEPKAGRLAKNQAYERLCEEANGDLLLFCGVDLRVEPTSLRQLVSLVKNQKVQMLSILPMTGASPHQTAFMQPLLGWLELAVPRFLSSAPAVSNSCWLIEKQLLKKLGGFGGVRHTIRPEKYFAKQASRGEYSFYRSNNELGVTTTKTVRGQWRSGSRLRYPQVQRRPESVLLTGFEELTFLLGPFIILILSIVWGDKLLIIVCALSCALLIINNLLISNSTRNHGGLLALLNFPASVLAEIYLIHYSMWQYEFGEVLWKGRNICLPVLQVTNRLPKL